MQLLFPFWRLLSRVSYGALCSSSDGHIRSLCLYKKDLKRTGSVYTACKQRVKSEIVKNISLVNLPIFDDPIEGGKKKRKKKNSGVTWLLTQKVVSLGIKARWVVFYTPFICTGKGRWMLQKAFLILLFELINCSSGNIHWSTLLVQLSSFCRSLCLLRVEQLQAH